MSQTSGTSRKYLDRSEWIRSYERDNSSLSTLGVIKRAEKNNLCFAVSIVMPKQSNRARVTKSTGTTG